MRSFSIRGVAVKGFYGPNAKTLANPFGAPQPSGGGGKTWTQIITGFEAVGFWLFGSFANGQYLIPMLNGTQSSVISSSNLSSFTNHNIVSSNYRPRGVTFGASTYVAVLDNNPGNAPLAYTSPDLVTWTQHATGFSATAIDQRLWQPIFGNSIFLLASQASAHYATSPDGVTWTQRSTYVPNQWGQPIYDGTRFVAAVMGSSNTAKIATSLDGITWTESTATLSAAFNAGTTPFFIGNNGTAQYIAAESADDAGNSVDGSLSLVTPFSFNDSGTNTGNSPVFSGASWARNNALNANLVSSSNGTTWVQDTVPATASFWVNIAFGGSFIAIGGDTGGNNMLATRGP